MTDPQLSRAEIWRRYELAEFGKDGNTFEVGHLKRLDAFFDWLVSALLIAQAAQLEQLKNENEREMSMTERDDLERGFHNRDGWYFRRDSDEGHVRIWKVRRDKAVRLCTSHCPPFRHQTQKEDGVQCDVVDADGNYIYSWVPVLVAGPHIIPENEWASIVASVSRGGETGASWQFVRDFHNGEHTFAAQAAQLETVRQERDELEAIKGTLDPSTEIADHPNVKFEQMHRLKWDAHLKAVQQENERLFARVASLEAGAPDEWTKHTMAPVKSSELD